MTITVAELKEKYPNPSSCFTGDYCVGGALVLESGDVYSHPDATRLSVHLLQQNAQLTKEEALSFAELVIEANDAQEYEFAWSHLNNALNHVS